MAVPNKKDRLRPFELIGLSAVIGVFLFLVVLMGTREPLVGLEFAGIGFIVALVVLAMLSLAARPKNAEQADIAEQDEEQDRPRGH
jgi:amino acid transporter